MGKNYCTIQFFARIVINNENERHIDLKRQCMRLATALAGAAPETSVATLLLSAEVTARDIM
jgi:hypothetical protein